MSGLSAWRIELHRRIPSRLKKHGKSVAIKIKAALQGLTTAPRRGKLLKNQEGLRSLPVTTPSGEFRILYRLIEEEKLILIDFIETREAVYEILKRS